MKKRFPTRIALSYLRRHKFQFTIALFWRGIWEIIPMQIPILVGLIVDGLTGKSVSVYGFSWSDKTSADVLQTAVIGLVAIALIYALSAYAYTIAQAKLSRRFVSTLRKSVIEKMMFLSLDHHQHYGAGEFLDRSLRDTRNMRSFIERVFIRTFTNTVRAIYPITMLFIINARLAVIALVIVPPLWFCAWYFQRKLHVATKKTMTSNASLTTVVKENLDGIETVKTLHAEKKMTDLVNEQSDQVETNELSAQRLTALMRGSVWLMTSLGLALVWWQGGLQVMAGGMTLGTLIAFTGFVDFTYRPFRQFTNIVKSYQQGLVSLERIHDLLETPSSVQTLDNAQPLKIETGQITFQNVAFTYGQQTILKQINLAIKPKQFTAIVGRSGSGKSSLLRLIPRLYDPEQGQVLIDGQPIEQFTLSSLRSQIGVVPQQPVLFSGTIRQNIRIGNPNATDQEIVEACEAAFALSFINRLEQGFETIVGQRGVSLSGGEKQRIAIARALLARPKILLMDEPTSALDTESEAAIVDLLRHLRQQMTVILVGHRPKTVCQADHIVVMDAGCVVAEGDHNLLQATSKLYNELFPSSQPVPLRWTSRNLQPLPDFKPDYTLPGQVSSGVVRNGKNKNLQLG